jgi:hypothetical protein
MRMRTRLAALTIGAAAAVAPMAAIPAASAAPSDNEPAPATAESGQEDVQYRTWFYTIEACLNEANQGYWLGLWEDSYCIWNGSVYELWVDYLFG